MVMSAEIKLQKKGIFFTFISIFFLFLFFTFLQLTNVEDETDDLNSQVTKIGVSNTIARSLETEFFPALAKISTTGALRGTLSYVEDTQISIPLDEQNRVFKSFIVNGTHPSEGVVRSQNNLTYLAELLQTTLTDEIYANVTLGFQTAFMNISQLSPWDLQIEILFWYSFVNDDFSWDNKTLLVRENVSLIGLNDPLFLFESIQKPITRSNRSVLDWNISNLAQHIRSGEYKAYTDAPSFLNRLANESSGSFFGIESLINPTNVGVVGLMQEKSYVDYLYFSDYDCYQEDYSLFEIDNVSDEDDLERFRIDIGHLALYLNNSQGSRELIDNVTQVCP